VFKFGERDDTILDAEQCRNRYRIGVSVVFGRILTRAIPDEGMRPGEHENVAAVIRFLAEHVPLTCGQHEVAKSNFRISPHDVIHCGRAVATEYGHSMGLSFFPEYSIEILHQWVSLFTENDLFQDGRIHPRAGLD
jgi:hypothetical protein